MQNYIVANWKSNKNLEEVELWWEEFIQLTIPHLDDLQDEVIIAPPYPGLMMLAQALETQSPKLSQHISLAVQDLSPYPAGSYTGAVCGRNLEKLGVKYALVGHSERRRYFHETHQDVANKVAQAVRNGITPIVCFDETYLRAQAEVIEFEYLEKCVVAYEPLTAIGTGHNVQVDEVAAAVAEAKEEFGQVPVLYGGSVKPDNVESYLEVVDGVLVGGASLNPDTFSQLVYRA